MDVKPFRRGSLGGAKSRQVIISLTGEHYEKVIVNLNDGHDRM
jgi:hypothetical protein